MFFIENIQKNILYNLILLDFSHLSATIWVEFSWDIWFGIYRSCPIEEHPKYFMYH